MQKHYDFKTIEREMAQFWSDNQTYMFKADPSRPIYSIDTPPPTVNGSLHIGHIFSYTQAEMIARFRRMQGYNVFYPFGFDDNGLPTERLVEKELGIRAGDMSRSAFVEACLGTTVQYEEAFKTLWSSLGFSCDWSLRYETISASSQRISQRSFIELYEKGKAYVKDSPVLWCTECKTSIAQAELESLQKETVFYTLKFRLCDASKMTDIEVATTRPELLYGCVSLFVHPEDERYKSLTGKHVRVPLYDYEIPILAEPTVSMEKGTGIVMCATYGDATDVTWTNTHNLPYRRVIETDGLISHDVPIIGGLTVNKARARIITTLENAGLIIKSEPIEHLIGIHERCGTPTEIMPSQQWYIDILTEKERFLNAADEINWYPSHMKNRYLNWVENLKWDWCVSRQRYFGVPIPVWYCAQCGEPILADKASLPVNPLESNPNAPCHCGSTAFLPESGVLDTWATSSLTPLINAKWGEIDAFDEAFMPMSMRTQAHEIIRTWAFYTIVKSLYHTGRLPWKDIMICGFVLAKKGEKISKSKDNSAESPQALIETHSADAIRYWAANAKLGTDTFFDADELAISKRLINKLWNASKFCFMQLKTYHPASDRATELLPIDRWILERMQETVNVATDALNTYEIGTARHAIDAFFFSDFCDNYLELAKERLYQPEKHGYSCQRSGQTALYEVLFGVLKLYAPYIPHITEYLYLHYFKAFESESSIHLAQWHKKKAPDEALLAFGDEIKSLLIEARRYKSENNLSMKSEMPFLKLQSSAATEPFYKESMGDIIACTGALEVG